MYILLTNKNWVYLPMKQILIYTRMFLCELLFQNFYLQGIVLLKRLNNFVLLNDLNLLQEHDIYQEFGLYFQIH